MLKAVIFDMDGVIVDSEPMHARANVIALREFGLDKPDEYYLGFAGTPKYDMMKTIIQDYNLDATPEMLVDAADAQNDIIYNQNGYNEIKGVCNLIKELYSEGIKLAVASSSPYRDIQSVLEYFHIDSYFEVILSGSDECFEPKPASDIYEYALQQLYVEPDEALAIEDTDVGIRAATGAGISCIAYDNPCSGIQNHIGATDIIDDFTQVNLQYLQSLL